MVSLETEPLTLIRSHHDYTLSERKRKRDMDGELRLMGSGPSTTVVDLAPRARVSSFGIGHPPRLPLGSHLRKLPLRSNISFQVGIRGISLTESRTFGRNREVCLSRFSSNPGQSPTVAKLACSNWATHASQPHRRSAHETRATCGYETEPSASDFFS